MHIKNLAHPKHHRYCTIHPRPRLVVKWSSIWEKEGPQRRESCRKGGALTPGARSCALPRLTFLSQKEMGKLGGVEVSRGRIALCAPGLSGKASPHTPSSLLQARNGGRRSRSAVKPQSDRRSPRRFASIVASLRSSFSPDTIGNRQYYKKVYDELVQASYALGTLTTL